VPPGTYAPQRPMRPALGSGAGCGPVPEVSRDLCPLPLDPPWSPGGVDQLALQ
jgi:hypothetical protein